MNSFKTAIGLLVSVGVLAISDAAFAADPLTVKVEPGVAVALNKPQTDHFDVGGAVSIKPLIGLTSFLDVGPVASVMVLPSKVGGDPGGAWGIGAGLRLKRPHDESNTDTGLKAISPWVDGDAQYVRTGTLDRSAFSVAVGASVPTSDARNVWVGPFVRYQDVVDSLNQRAGYNNTDAHVLVVGLSVELGPRAKVKKEVARMPSDRDHDGTVDDLDSCPDVPGPKENFGCPFPQADKPSVKPAPQVSQRTLELKEVVQFDWDSDVLRTLENDVLRQAVSILSKNTDYSVKIEGHASSEGDAKHNDALSQKRANSVLEYLVKQGVSRDRLTAKGYGSSVPYASNATKEGRESNRRVEFTVKLVLTFRNENK